MKSYDDLATDLEAMPGTDPEAEHAEADEIITAAITLAAVSGVPPTFGEANRLLAAFGAVRKWYA